MLFLMEVHIFRRFHNRQNWPTNLPPEQIEAAVKANRLLTAGQPGEAAVIFARIAQEMEDSQHPRLAVNLHARAAHAYADSKNETSALIQARVALSLFIQYKMVNRTQQFYTNITNKLTQRGMSKEVEILNREFGKVVGELPTQFSQGRMELHRTLPPACTQCGAPLRSDEVEWIDDQTVECGYCGALIKTS
jgi:hypothetical protein